MNRVTGALAIAALVGVAFFLGSQRVGAQPGRPRYEIMCQNKIDDPWKTGSTGAKKLMELGGQGWQLVQIGIGSVFPDVFCFQRAAP
jgi:hypothetical protein